VLIAVGIACQLIQLYVSVRDRKQNMCESGDPWNGHTLEWSTSSPPPFYNFAVMPTATHRRVHRSQGNGTAYQKPSTNRSTCQQHRHWRGDGRAVDRVRFRDDLAHLVAGHRQPAGTIGYFVVHAARDDQGYMVPVETIERIEAEQHKRLVAEGRSRPTVLKPRWNRLKPCRT
jgi:cytochrome o ubiquinol oxidase subunit 1